MKETEEQITEHRLYELRVDVPLISGMLSCLHRTCLRTRRKLEVNVCGTQVLIGVKSYFAPHIFVPRLDQSQYMGMNEKRPFTNITWLVISYMQHKYIVIIVIFYVLHHLSCATNMVHRRDRKQSLANQVPGLLDN